MKYKHDVFISYSSHDRDIVEHLSKELKDKGLRIWLDKWQIKVGEQIVQEISKGLESSRYLAIWLSEHSVMSKWVEKEWQSKYWDEVDNNLTVVLPLLGEKCEIPFLLKGRKYADFSKSFDVGLSQLLEAMELNSSLVIEYCIKNLIDGKESKECAEKLERIAVRSSDEEALNGLWIAAQKTKKPNSVVDHCAYYIGRVMIESVDSVIQQRGFEILKSSTMSKSEVVVDKFAFTAGEVSYKAGNEQLREQVLSFIGSCSVGKDALIRDKYTYTKNRVKNIDNA